MVEEAAVDVDVASTADVVVDSVVVDCWLVVVVESADASPSSDEQATTPPQATSNTNNTDIHRISQS